MIQRYICQAADCRLESEFPATLETNPVCVCGSPMKKVYSPPVVRELKGEEAVVQSEYLRGSTKVDIP
jgi:hypothetical protein